MAESSGTRVRGFDPARAAGLVVVVLSMVLYWFGLILEINKNEGDARLVAVQHAEYSAATAAEAVTALLDRFRVSLRIAATAATQGHDALSLYGDVVASGADELVFQLFYIGADGYLVYSSLGAAPRNYLGDRDYFKILAEGQRDFVVSPPVLGRLTNKWSIQVAHAVRQDGRFLGVVAMAVSPERWVEHLRKFQQQPNDVVTLFSPDGIYLLRTLDTQHSLGQRLGGNRPFLDTSKGESGVYTGPGVLDGVDRIYAWRRLPSGHVVTSGVALDDALVPVRTQNRVTLLRGLLATAALLGAMAVIAYFVLRADRVAQGIAEKEYMQRMTLSVMAEGLAIVDGSGEITFHNDSFARLVPYEGDRLRRRQSFQRWDLTDANGHPLSLDDFPSVITARTGRSFDNLKVGLRLPDGGTHWLNLNTRPLMDEGIPYGAILTMTDITSQCEAERALKLSEERHRTVVNALMEGIVVQNADGEIISANPAAEYILGVAIEDLLGCSSVTPQWRAIHADGTPFPGDEHPAMVTLRTGQHQNGVIMGLPKADGSITWIEINTAPLWGDSSGRPAAVVASLLDITNRKTFEDELSRSNAELEQFAYAVSHDLREPLRMVASYVGLIERRLGAELTAEMREFIGFAVEGAKRMDRMLVALLEYSRVGRVGQPMDWMDSRKALDEALLFLTPTIQQSGAEITISGDWPELYASSDEVERLFQNLLGNALKYHQDGVAPKVAVTAIQDGAVWRFSFTDNGIGIASDQAGRLFKVFQRLHSVGQYEGSGVGLALCRKIVQRYDGRIWVESQGAGTGSSFIFTLPLGQVRAIS